MNKCAHCGAINTLDATTCQECGRPLSPVHSQSATQTSGTAIASLVCGILGWTIVPLIGSILAIVLGYLARDQIRASYGNISGDGLAIIGLILGYSSIALAVGAAILTILAIALGFALPMGILGCALCAG